MDRLSKKSSTRLQTALCPATAKCYAMLFRTFVAFCVVMKISFQRVTTQCVLSFLEYLVSQNYSVYMLANYVAAIKTKFVMYSLNYHVLEDPKIRYFIKAVKINRPLCVPTRIIMSVSILKSSIGLCTILPMGSVYRAVFSVALFLFGCLRISNIAPYFHAAFDSSRHITASDVTFSKRFVKIIIKWTKTIQTRDKVHVLSLPRLKVLSFVLIQP